MSTRGGRDAGRVGRRGRRGRWGPRRGRAVRAGLAALAGLGLAACAGEGGEPLAEELATAETDAIVVPDTLAADSAAPDPDTAEADRPGLPAMPGEGAQREFRLRLVNPHDREARVFASAGAARVALDTVPGRDSTLVDIRVRADGILLEAEDERGVGVGSIELDLVHGGENRWEIGPPPGPRVTASAGGSWRRGRRPTIGRASP